MSRRPGAWKLTPEQQKALFARHGLYRAYRREALKNSVTALAHDFGVDETTIRRYLEMHYAKRGTGGEAAPLQDAL